MINHRDKGYATLHKIILVCVLFAWFWGALHFWESFEYSLISLPWNYALVAIAGLVVATFGSFQHYGLFFIKNGWGRIRESCLKTNFQISLIAFCASFLSSHIYTPLPAAKPSALTTIGNLFFSMNSFASIIFS